MILPIQAKPVMRTDIGNSKNFQVEGSLASGIYPSCTCNANGDPVTNNCGPAYNPQCNWNQATLAYSCNCVRSLFLSDLIISWKVQSLFG
jgi:hypothetical protein